MSRLLSDVLDEWMLFHSDEIEASTAYTYSREVLCMKEYFKDIKIKKLTSKDIQDYISYLKKEKRISDTTLISHCKSLKMCLKYAKRNKYISKNPIKGVALPKKNRVEIYPFTILEMDEVLRQKAPEWVRDGVIISYRTGMRLGEIFGLRWNDINFDHSFLMVQRTLSRAGSKIIIKTTKSPAGVRRIDIDSITLAYLKMMKEKSKSVYVFSMPDDPEMFRKPWNISDKLRKMCIEAGVVPRSFHTVRHSHATTLMEKNTHPKIVQERLGHSNISVTMDIYSHVTPTIQENAVKVYENINIPGFDQDNFEG